MQGDVLMYSRMKERTLMTAMSQGHLQVQWGVFRTPKVGAWGEWGEKGGEEEEEEEGRRRGLGTGKHGLHYIVVSLRGSKRQQRARSVTNEADARNLLSGHQAALS